MNEKSNLKPYLKQNVQIPVELHVSFLIDSFAFELRKTKRFLALNSVNYRKNVI